MAKLVLNGDTSGSVTLDAPAVSGTTTLTLPTTSGTVLTNGTNTNFPAGSVLQVVNANRTPNTQTESTTTNAWIDTYLSASITPKLSTSKILVIASSSFYLVSGSSFPTINFGLKRAISGGSTTTGIGSQCGLYFDNRSTGTLFASQVIPATLSYLDSPATTSATTYTLQYYFRRVAGGSGAGGDSVNDTATTTTPTITLIEIAS
jgi:hypothetical protein